MTPSQVRAAVRVKVDLTLTIDAHGRLVSGTAWVNQEDLERFVSDAITRERAPAETRDGGDPNALDPMNYATPGSGTASPATPAREGAPLATRLRDVATGIENGCTADPHGHRAGLLRQAADELNRLTAALQTAQVELSEVTAQRNAATDRAVRAERSEMEAQENAIALGDALITLRTAAWAFDVYLSSDCDGPARDELRRLLRTPPQGAREQEEGAGV